MSHVQSTSWSKVIRLAVLGALCAIALVACGRDPCLACGLSNLVRLKQLVAEYYAPVIFQDTDSDGYQYDYITKVNFDGDYDASNNRAHADSFQLPGYVYYSVSATSTHFFIGYYFYHPYDSGDGTHDNDLEGIMLMVNRSRGDGVIGELVAMETEAHGQLYQYAYCPDRNGDGSVDKPDADHEGEATVKSTRVEDLDGCIRVYTAATGTIGNAQDGSGCVDCTSFTLPYRQSYSGVHPLVYSQAQGHGVGACGYGILLGEVDCENANGGDGIVYYHGYQADVPMGGGGNWVGKYMYRLIPMDANDPNHDLGLWYLQNPDGSASPSVTFQPWARFTGEDNGADAPWGWDDPDDAQVHVGDIFCDPAFTFDTHLNGSEFTRPNYSLSYTDHVYYTHYLRLIEVMTDTTHDDVYIRVGASFDQGSPYGSGVFIEGDNWQVNDMQPGVWHQWFHGGYDATGARAYAYPSSARHICRPPGLDFGFRPYDENSDAVDDPIDNLWSVPASSMPVVNPDSPSLPVETNLGHVDIKLALFLNSTFFNPSPDWWVVELESCRICKLTQNAPPPIPTMEWGIIQPCLECTPDLPFVPAGTPFPPIIVIPTPP